MGQGKRRGNEMGQGNEEKMKWDNENEGEAKNKKTKKNEERTKRKINKVSKVINKRK
jgi:hypothetical protein